MPPQRRITSIHRYIHLKEHNSFNSSLELLITKQIMDNNVFVRIKRLWGRSWHPVTAVNCISPARCARKYMSFRLQPNEDWSIPMHAVMTVKIISCLLTYKGLSWTNKILLFGLEPFDYLLLLFTGNWGLLLFTLSVVVRKLLFPIKLLWLRDFTFSMYW